MNISDLVPWKASRAQRLPVRRGEENPMIAFQREMDRLFDRFFDLESFLGDWPERVGAFSPSVNVAERDDEIVVTAELPGMDEKDIEITLNRDVLTVKGEKKEESEEKSGSYYRRERSYGSFSRTIGLPADVVDTDKVEATFKNGVLTIALPKAEVQEPSKRITVKAT